MEWKVLAALRFVLASIVAANHLTVFDDQSVMSIVARLSGLAAIIGFLMISGYSIAHSLETQPAGFYWRRFIRIMPLYVLALLAGFGLGLWPHYAGLPHRAGFSRSLIA